MAGSLPDKVPMREAEVDVITDSPENDRWAIAFRYYP
jgi:hypothetical protein